MTVRCLERGIATQCGLLPETNSNPAAGRLRQVLSNLLFTQIREPAKTALWCSLNSYQGNAKQSSQKHVPAEAGMAFPVLGKNSAKTDEAQQTFVGQPRNVCLAGAQLL
jgi:hypothetical protein